MTLSQAEIIFREIRVDTISLQFHLNHIGKEIPSRARDCITTEIWSENYLSIQKSYSSEISLNSYSMCVVI